MSVANNFGHEDEVVLPPTSSPPASEIEGAILRHLLRYRITTAEALRESFSLDSTDNQLEGVLKLYQRGLIEMRPLFGDMYYFKLTEKGAHALKINDSRLYQTFSPKRLLERLAILSFCLMGETKRELYFTEELLVKYPALLQNSLPKSRFYHTFDGVTLGYLFLDLGQGHKRLYQRVCEFEAERLKDPTFHALIQARKFTITVLTPSKRNKSLLHNRYTRRPTVSPFMTLVVREMQEFLDATREEHRGAGYERGISKESFSQKREEGLA